MPTKYYQTYEIQPRLELLHTTLSTYGRSTILKNTPESHCSVLQHVWTPWGPVHFLPSLREDGFTILDVTGLSFALPALTMRCAGYVQSVQDCPIPCFSPVTPDPIYDPQYQAFFKYGDGSVAWRCREWVYLDWQPIIGGRRVLVARHAEIYRVQGHTVCHDCLDKADGVAIHNGFSADDADFSCVVCKRTFIQGNVFE